MILPGKLICALLIVALAEADIGASLSDEKRLIKHLVENYRNIGLIGRPVFNTSETTRVYFGMALIWVKDFKPVNNQLGYVTIRAWDRYLWHDVLMQWNPADFGGVDHIRVPARYIWNPDLVLYNSWEVNPPTQQNAMAVISHDGTVLYIPNSEYTVPCKKSGKDWSCSFKFGSWTYDGFKLDVDFYDGLEEIDVNDYGGDFSGYNFRVVSHSARKNVKYYPCCVEPYPDLTFELVLGK